jgi:preprotein translocase SecE subunit
MESQQQKWVVSSFLSVAFLLAYLIISAGMYAGGTYDLEARVKNFELIVRGISVFAGLFSFILLYRNEAANKFMGEVVVELGRVSWPNQKEAGYSTVVVIVMVLISGMILGFLDILWAYLLKLVL